VNKLLPLVLFALAIVVNSNWWRIELMLNPISHEQLGGYSIIMYSTSSCRYCAKARRFFSASQLPYKEYDIEKSAIAHQEYKQLGGRGVPVIKIGPHVIQGFDHRTIRKVVDQLDKLSTTPE